MARDYMAIESPPTANGFFLWLTATTRADQPDPNGEAIELLDAEVLKPSVPDRSRRTALYLRAKACDRLKRYEEAWESAAKANAIGDPQFDPALYTEAVGALMQHWNRAEMAKFNATLQAAYFIIAVRALGLAAGPMSGFDYPAMDAEFFPDGRHASVLVVNFGMPGTDAWFPRLPRLDYDQAVTVL
jgi:nitroreductase